MSNPKVSVVLPIYNVEDYLEDALNCLLNQTFIDEMEVLMIDDGSSDNSRYVIEKYALDYDNFRAFHKENEGPALTRNFGIDHAKGDYIHFLDADDYITPDGYERLYNIAVENNSDIVTAPVIRLRRYNIFDGKFYRNSLKKFDRDISSTTFESHEELIWDLFITNKLYSRDFLNENNLRNNVGNKAYCDDGPFSLKAYILSDKVSISTDVFYYWRLREIGIPSITQKLNDTETFYDRLDAIKLSFYVLDNYELDQSLLDEFYLKILNHDLYLHLSKFHIYDEKYHLEFIKDAKTVLNRIPSKYLQKLNSYKKVIYQMVEDEDIEGLVKFSALEPELRQNPQIPDNLDEKYVKFIDFDADFVSEDLIARKEEILLEDDNLLITYKKRLNYLRSDYPYKTVVKLIDEENEEVILDENDSKITVPIDLIKDKNHMKIKIELIFDSFKKQCYLTNSRRTIFELDDFDIEIGIGANNIFLLDIKPTNNLVLEIEDISFESNVFKFSGISDGEISKVFIQNVVTFDKIFYDIKSVKQDKSYQIEFSIPYDDILSFPVRKWELRVDGPFKIIRLTNKFEFHMNYNFTYMINIRNKILISDDFYNSLEKLNENFDKIGELKSANKELKKLNRQLKKDNKKVLNENKKLLKENKKLEKKNAKLNEKNQILENKVINVKPIKNKLFKK